MFFTDPQTDLAIALSEELIDHLGLQNDERITAHRVADRLTWNAVLAEPWSSTEQRVLSIAATIYTYQPTATILDLFSLPDEHFEAALGALHRARVAGILS